METKKCITCKKELPIEMFGKSRQTNEGISRRCIDCCKAKEEKKAARRNKINRFWECDLIAKPQRNFDRLGAKRMRDKRLALKD